MSFKTPASIFFWLCLAWGAGLLPAKETPILTIDTQGHSAIIRDVVFTSDGAQLVSASDDKTIRVWEVASGRILRVIRGEIEAGPGGKIFALALSPDNRYLAAGGWMKIPGLTGHHIRLYDFRTGRLLALLQAHTNVINALAFSPDSRWLASGSGDFSVKLWDVAQQKVLHTLAGHRNAVYGVAFAPDGRRLVSAADDSTLKLWDTRSGALLQTLQGHRDKVYAVAWSPDGAVIASGGWDQNLILWEARSGSRLRTIDNGTDPSSLAFSPDGKYLVTGIGTSPWICKVYRTGTWEVVRTFERHDDIVLATAFAPDSRTIATGGGKNNDIYLWDVRTGEVQIQLSGQGGNIWAVGCAPNKNWFGFTRKYTADKGFSTLTQVFRLDDFSTGELPDPANYTHPLTTVNNYTLKHAPGGDYGYDNAVLQIQRGGQVPHAITRGSTDGYRHSCYTFTPNGQLILSGGSHGSITAYTLEGEQRADLIGHTGKVWGVAVSGDGQLLLSGSNDQTLRLWNLQSLPADKKAATLQPLASLFIALNHEWVLWTPQGYYAASAGGEKYIGWQINHGPDQNPDYYSVDKFQAQFYQPELVKRAIELRSFDQAFTEYNQTSRRKLVQRAISSILPPKIEWLVPSAFESTAANKAIDIKARITSDTPIREFKVLHNGRPQAAERAIRLGENLGHTSLVERRITLNPGKNEISILATNENGTSAPALRVIHYTAAVPDWQKPSLYLLAIGISAYDQADLRLRFATDDARSFALAMRTQQGKFYKDVRVRELIDTDATREKILNHLDWLAREVTQKDVAMVFIAGHGTNDPTNNFYIIPVDGDPLNLRSTCVSSRELYDVFGNLPAKMLLFLDTCHSGQFSQNVMIAMRNVDNTEAIRELSSPEIGVVTFNATTGREFSQERPEWGHGAFTLALLEALEKGEADYNKDGMVYIHELQTYLPERVKTLTNGAQHANIQVPQSITGQLPVFQWR